jgi:heptosyltransferase-2
VRCLVIQTAFLGDVILTVPLLRLLRGLDGVTRVGAVVTPSGSELLRDQGIVDEIIEYDKRGRDRGPAGFLRVARAARRLGVDAALVPHRSFRSALLALAAGAGDRVGFDASGGRILLTRAIPYALGDHEAVRVARLIEGLGGALPASGLPIGLTVPDVGRDEAVGALAAAGVGAAEIVVLAPGSAWATKRWPAERFAGTADALRERLGAAVVLSGSEADRGVAADVARRTAGPVIDLTGHLSVSGWIALIARARLLVSNDSAAAHVAAAVGTPVVAVFGPTVPAQGFAPYGARSRVVEAAIACRPCGRHGAGRCRRGDLACMRGVPVEAVVGESLDLVGAAAPSCRGRSSPRPGAADRCPGPRRTPRG